MKRENYSFVWPFINCQVFLTSWSKKIIIKKNLVIQIDFGKSTYMVNRLFLDVKTFIHKT